ncbi:hypothetical protein OH76DRAFT_1413103, partial [Lentinus brumalis]
MHLVDAAARYAARDAEQETSMRLHHEGRPIPYPECGFPPRGRREATLHGPRQTQTQTHNTHISCTITLPTRVGHDAASIPVVFSPVLAVAISLLLPVAVDSPAGTASLSDLGPHQHAYLYPRRPRSAHAPFWIPCRTFAGLVSFACSSCTVNALWGNYGCLG